MTELFKSVGDGIAFGIGVGIVIGIMDWVKRWWDLREYRRRNS